MATDSWAPSPYAEAVLDLVDQIPPGRVLAYGDVAALLGAGGPRQVAAVMSHYGSGVPWWRVVRADGSPAPLVAVEALARLRSEGTPLVGGQLAGARVDIRQARWQPPETVGAG